MENIQFGKRPKNPLRRRVFRDLLREWKRYLMIFAMLVVTIGFVSGMYVANNSMMTSLNGNAAKFHREDGHFELSRIAEPEIIEAIETGEKADMVSIFRERAYKEAEPEIEKAVREAVEEKVREQVAVAITEQVTAAVDAQIKESAAELPDDMRQEMLDQALKTAMNEKYEEAAKEALDKARNSAEYKDALAEATDKAHKEIDEKIDKAAKGWSISRIGKVELAVLRLAIYEMLYDEDIPVGVAIDEAVELSKRFGQESSGPFVNGILATLAG